MDIYAFSRSKRIASNELESKSKSLDADKQNITNAMESLRTSNDTKVVNRPLDSNIKPESDSPEYIVLVNRIANIMYNVDHLDKYLSQDTKDIQEMILKDSLTDPYVEAVTDCVCNHIGNLDKKVGMEMIGILGDHYRSTDSLAWKVIFRKPDAALLLEAEEFARSVIEILSNFMSDTVKENEIN